MTYVVQAVETTAAVLRKGQLIILESTTYPGTTDEVVQPILEAKGLKAGRDFYLAFSPERVDPGQPALSDQEHPEGRRRHQRDSTDVAVAFYGQVMDTVVPVSSHARRRDGEAAREHLPRRQHRPGQRAGADVPPHGPRRVGSDRRRQDQAVRLHAVLPGPGPGRPLHPDRSRSTCRGRRSSSTSRRASSSSPASSTARCPNSSCSASSKRSTPRRSR